MKTKLLRQAAINLLTACLLLTACSDEQESSYVIGVSQCSDDIWREKLNDELRTSSFLYEGIKLHFASAYDSDERQVEQIDSLLRLGIDLLIVAPNQVKTISPAIDKVFDQGIPVIVIDRKTNSNKYTAYIGADNYDMGHQMGEYIAKKMGGKGNVLEIMGLKGSSPSIERHKGFNDAIKQFPGIVITDSLQGDWTEESGRKAVEERLPSLKHPDYVFAHNDRMAIGARKALEAAGINSLICGIDGLPGPNSGIEQVRDSLLDATYTYPTRGDLVMKLAMNILNEHPYEHENLMESAIVTNANAEVMLMQAEEMWVQTAQLDKMHNKVDWYFTQYRHQQVYLMLLGIIILLILIGAWYALHTIQRRHELEREAFELVVSESEPIVEPSPAQVPSDDSSTQQTETQKQEVLVQAESPFLEQLRAYVHEGMSDSNFSVETLAEKMNLSRVQFYRKVKVLTGRTPVDIIRQSRLNRAKILLQTTNKSISEVAYEVGFSAPSYFTKCFKDEFGISPSDLQ